MPTEFVAISSNGLISSQGHFMKKEFHPGVESESCVYKRLAPNYSGIGTYPRADALGRSAKYVYSHILEPKMLLWLISASEVAPQLVKAAQESAGAASSMPGKSAAIRKCVPWPLVAAALLTRSEAKVQLVVPPDVLAPAASPLQPGRG